MRGLRQEIKTVLKYRDFESLHELVQNAQFAESQIKKEEIFHPPKSTLSSIQVTPTHYLPMNKQQSDFALIRQLRERVRQLE